MTHVLKNMRLDLVTSVGGLRWGFFFFAWVTLQLYLAWTSGIFSFFDHYVIGW